MKRSPVVATLTVTFHKDRTIKTNASTPSVLLAFAPKDKQFETVFKSLGLKKRAEKEP